MNGLVLVVTLVIGAIAIIEIVWEFYRHRDSISRALSGPIEMERGPHARRFEWFEFGALAALIAVIWIGFAAI